MGKIGREVAEAEFARFVEAMGLKAKVNPEGLDAKDAESLADTINLLLRTIESGHLVIDEKGQAVFTPQVSGGEPIVFPEPRGADIMAMDQAKEGRKIEAQNKVLASITKQNPQRYSQMLLRDYDVISALCGIFFARR